MIERFQTIWFVGIQDAKRHMRSQRMLILSPLIILAISMACWGFADARIVPAGLPTNSPSDVLFYSSLPIVFFCTLSVVLIGFDTISRRRLTGELAIDLSQPMPRADYAISQLLGVWIAAMSPTTIAIVIGTFLIQQQMGEWPSYGDFAMFLGSTALLLWWYTCLQLLASSLARDIGSSVTLGVGTWLFFVFLWLIPTLIVAQTMGVDITDPNSVGFDRVQEKVDLFSPNGVYQLMMETRLSGESEPMISPRWIWLSAMAWILIPSAIFIKRISSMRA